MRITSLSWRTFRIPFRRQFATASAALAYRTGVVVQLGTDAGIVGLGEASPLPRQEGTILPKEGTTLPQVLTLLKTARDSLKGKSVDEVPRFSYGSDPTHPAAAAVRCALDTAACDVLAQAQRISVAAFLTSNAQRSVNVNAVIGDSSLAAACEAAAQAVASGFNCVKLKVGTALNVEEEGERVAAVREVLGPAVALRIDANGAWDVEQAVRTIRALEPFDLEFVEQPVRPGHLVDMKRVREAVSTPIAADEDVIDLDSARHILQLGSAQLFVIKPMIVGGLRPARQIIEEVEAANAVAIVTTTLDAGVGVAAALHLAATLTHSGPACGLATSDRLTHDLLTRPLVIQQGRMELPRAAGLGVELNEHAVEQYSLREA